MANQQPPQEQEYYIDCVPQFENEYSTMVNLFQVFFLLYYVDSRFYIRECIADSAAERTRMSPFRLLGVANDVRPQIFHVGRV